MFIESFQSRDALRGEVFAVLDHPFAAVADALGLAILHAHAARHFEALGGAKQQRTQGQYKAGRTY